MSARVGGAVAAAGRVAPTHGDRLVSAPALHAGHDGTRGESALSNTVRRVEFEAFLGGRGAKRGAAASTGARKTLAPRGGAFSGLHGARLQFLNSDRRFWRTPAGSPESRKR